MPLATSPSTVADPLRLAGGVLLLARGLDQALRGAHSDGLTLNELGMLGQIERGVDLPSQLARAMRLDPARVTHLLDRLAEHRYIDREADARDRRCWRLRLTEAGTARLVRGRAETAAAMETLLASVREDELAALALGLEGVRRALTTPAEARAEAE